MKLVEIFVLGKYEYTNRVGTWIYYLNYKKAVIKRSGYIINAGSPTRTTLISLYNALERITEPCNIIVHSKMALGFKKPKQSLNKDLIVQILTLVNKAGHQISFDTKDDFGRVDIWEQVYGTKSDGTKTKLPDNKENKQKDGKTNAPDIRDKSNPNDVFNTERPSNNWKDMYNELLNDDKNTRWVPGSGGY